LYAAKANRACHVLATEKLIEETTLEVAMPKGGTKQIRAVRRLKPGEKDDGDLLLA
jgi:hypothetical protein